MPKTSKNMSPTLCMRRDKEVLDFCINSLTMLEPCSVIGISGFGVKTIFFEMVKKIGEVNPKRMFKSLNAQNPKELEDFLEELQTEEHPVTAAIYFSTDEDCSWFVREMDDLRDRKRTNFVPFFFAMVGEVYEAIVNTQKVLFRSPFILPPVDHDDMLQLLDDFEKRFSFTLKTKDVEKIYKLSGGHIGLIKSLYLLLKNNPNVNLEEESLVNLPSIASRLEEVVKLFPKDLLKDLYYYPNDSKYKDLFERYYFVKNGKIFSPLLFKYLEKSVLYSLKANTSIGDFKLDLSKSELDIFNILHSKLGKIVSRDDLANTQWKDDAEEKYSDWAIDQIIYRLRSKLKSNKVNYKIITKKGRGFVLQNK